MESQASHKSRSSARLITIMAAFAVSAGLLLGGCPGVEPLQGPVGPQGPAGPQGEEGVVGDPGQEGQDAPAVPGPQGDEGPTGPAGPEGEEGPEGPEGSEGPQGEEGPAGGTITAHSQLSGLDADDHPQYVMNGEANAVTTAMIADAAVTLPKIDTAGADANQIMKFVAGQLVWADDEIGTPGSGDISAVYADDGLTGGATSGDAHISVGAGTGITVNADTVGVDTNWADGRYVNEGQQNSITSAMIVDNAVGSTKIASGAVGSSEVANNSLTASDLASDSVGLSELNASGGSSERYLKHTGSGMEWDTVPGGSSLWSEGSGGRIYYNGGNVGIGRSDPDEKLYVVGDIWVTVDVNVEDDVHIDDDLFVDDKADIGGNLIVDGKVGVNDSSPVARLSVKAGSSGTALYAEKTGTGFAINAAGFVGVAGDAHVSGHFSKGSGSFKIDHPLDPENKYLYHSFVESPDMMNIYNGNVITDGDGYASVLLPDWFEVLNSDYRYQLTVIGDFAQAIVASEIEEGQFSIRTDKPYIKVSWQVTGIRQDPFASANRIPVEEHKPPEERGYFLHPGAYGQPEMKSFRYAHPEYWPTAREETAEIGSDVLDD